MAFPPELLSRIIGHLDPADISTASDLCRFSRCSRLFHNVASDRQLWRDLYTHRWRRHRSRATYIELLLRDSESSEGVDWKAEYGQRSIQDRAALQCVRRMVGEPIGRYSEARYILEDAQMGVFDCLLSFQRKLANDYAFHDQLSEKLWVREVLDALRRSESIQTWHQLLFDESRSEATVACISAFSGFRGADRVEMEDKFASLAEFTRERLGVEYLHSRPDQREVSKGICQAMASKGIRPSSPQTFHRLQNAFLNLVIDNGASTLPMSLVCIFCAIAHRLGLNASIINFPNRILARIEGWKDLEENEQQDSYILDIFEYGEVLSEADITNRLSFIGIPQTSARNFLHSAAPSEVITRVGRNIIESLTREEGGIVGSNDNSRSAHAAVASLLFVQPMVDALPNILYQFPMDVFSIERDYIPIVQREGVEGFLMADRLRLTQRSILERDAQAIQPRIRAQELKPEEGDNKDIEYHIGTIFRHRRWGYIGVIKRWDPRCCADEVWMQGNNVDALDNGGRAQPFYSISADDGSDRYIAQINVIPMRSVHAHTIHRLINRHENLGWTFARADPERGIFVMDESHKRKYPEDAKWQEEVLSQPAV